MKSPQASINAQFPMKRIACLSGCLFLFQSPAMAQLAVGQSIGVDFDDGGDTAGAGVETNFLILTAADLGGVFSLDTTDVTGASTNGVTVSFEVVDSFLSGDMGEATLGWGDAGVGSYTGTFFSDATYNDGLFSNNGSTMIVTFENLDDSLSYNLVLLPMGPGDQDTLVEFSVNGSPLGGASYDEIRPDTNVISPFIALAATDGAGQLELRITSSNFYGFAGLTITATDDPPDSDNDNLPDFWELSQTGVIDLDDLDGTVSNPNSTGSGSGDFDGDLLSDIDEYNEGEESTDPGNPDTDDDLLSDKVETRTGVFVSSEDTGTSPLLKDTDGDNLDDDIETGTGTFVDEFDTGTDPNFADTDGDELNDDYEVANFEATATGPDPNVDNSDDDFDEDGSSTLDEVLAGTDVLNEDTDDDGLFDGVETNSGIFFDETDTGTNPLVEDTDNDGLIDSVETGTELFVSLNDTGTDPTEADSDTDGFSDGIEVALGSDPNDTDDVPSVTGLMAGQTIGLDFDDESPTDGSGIEPNFVIFTPADVDSGVLSRLTTDVTGASTGGVSVSFDFLGGFSFGEMNNANLGWGAGGVGIYDGTFFSDLTYNDGFFFDPSSGMGITFENLNPSLTYDLTLLPMGPTVEDPVMSFTANGEEIGSASYNDIRPDTSQLSPLVVTGLSADEDGMLSIEATAEAFIGFAGMTITAVGDVAPPQVPLVLSVGYLDGSTLTMTMVGAPNTTYVCKSSTGLQNFDTTETTMPGVVMTGADGVATFSIQTNSRSELFLRMEAASAQAALLGRR